MSKKTIAHPNDCSKTDPDGRLRHALGRIIPQAFAINTPPAARGAQYCDAITEPEPVRVDHRERQDVGSTLEVAAGILSGFVHDVARAGIGLRRGEPDRARAAFAGLRKHRAMAAKAVAAVDSALEWYGCSNG